MLELLPQMNDENVLHIENSLLADDNHHNSVIPNVLAESAVSSFVPREDDLARSIDVERTEDDRYDFMRLLLNSEPDNLQIAHSSTNGPTPTLTTLPPISVKAHLFANQFVAETPLAETMPVQNLSVPRVCHTPALGNGCQVNTNASFQHMVVSRQEATMRRKNLVARRMLKKGGRNSVPPRIGPSAPITVTPVQASETPKGWTATTPAIVIASDVSTNTSVSQKVATGRVLKGIQFNAGMIKDVSLLIPHPFTNA